MNFRVSAKQKKSRENEEKMSKKMLGLDKYEAEKANEKWYTKYINNGLFSTKNALPQSKPILGVLDGYQSLSFLLNL